MQTLKLYIDTVHDFIRPNVWYLSSYHLETFKVGEQVIIVVEGKTLVNAIGEIKRLRVPFGDLENDKWEIQETDKGHKFAVMFVNISEVHGIATKRGYSFVIFFLY